MSDREILAFNFPELIADLQEFVSTFFLDLPTRFALALTSTQFYRRFFIDGIKKANPHFDGWIFMDECVRLGHLKLLQWARASGARVDSLLLEAAIEAGQGEVALWLLMVLREKYGSYIKAFSPDAIEPMQKAEDAGKLAGRKGLVEVARELLSHTRDQSWQVASSLLEGGHVDLAKSIRNLPLSKRIMAPPASGLAEDEVQLGQERAWPCDELESAARLGRVALFHKAFESSPPIENSSDPMTNSVRLFAMSLEGCSLEIIRFVYERVLKPQEIPSSQLAIFIDSMLFQNDKFSILHRPDIIQFLLEVIPEMRGTNQDLFLWTCVVPNLEVFKLLFPKEGLRPSEKKLLLGKFLNIMEPQHRLLICQTRQERMECLRFAHEKGLRWRWPDLVFTWGNPEDLKWLLEQCDGIWNETYSNLLVDYFKANNFADLGLVEYALAKAEVVAGEVVFQASFLLNSFDLIERFGVQILTKIVGTASVFFVKILETLLTLVRVTGVRVKSEYLTPEKMRPRPKLWARTINTLVQQGWATGIQKDANRLIGELRVLLPGFEVSDLN